MDSKEADDPTVLQWASAHGRVLLTQDLSTMRDFAYHRVASGQSMSGVIVIAETTPAAVVLDDLVHIVGASEAHEWVDRVVFLPLR